MTLGPIGPIPSPASVKSSTATLTGTTGGAVGPDSVGNINLAGTNVTIAGNPVTNTLTFTSAGGSGSGTVTTYVTNAGSATASALGALNLTGNTSQGLTLSGSGNTVTVAGLDASDTVKGVVELATTAETITGSSATLATTPAGVNAKLGAQTLNALPVGQGSTAAPSWVGPLTNGQILIGATGSAPTAATLSPGANITITNSANGITIAASSAVTSTVGLAGNSGSVTGLGGTVAVIGDNQAITTIGEPGGSGQSLTISLIAPVLVSYGGTGRQTITSRAVLLGAGALAVSVSNVGSNGQVLIAGGTGNDPAFATITSTGRSLTYTTSANGFNLDINAPVVVSYGGTGQQTLTQHTVLVGAGTSPITQLGPLTNGQLVIGQTGLAPVAATLSPGANITITNSAGGITIAAAGSITAIALFGNTGSATGLAGTVSVIGDPMSITTAGEPGGNGRSLTISLVAPVLVSYGGTGRQTITSRSVLLGAGTFPVSVSNVGSNGTVLIAGGAGNDPAFATITSTGRSLTYTTSANGFNLDIDSPVVVSYGGTGNRTLTSRAVLLGAGTFPVSVSNIGSNGTVLIAGGAGNDPAFATITSTGRSLTYTTSANGFNLDIDSPVVVSYGGTGQRSLTSRAVLIGEGTFPVSVSNIGTNGQVLIAGGTGNDPAFATITSTGGTIAFTYGPNSLNMEASVHSWTVVSSTFQAMSPQNSYIANNAARVELLLPTVSAVGTMVQVSGQGAGGWRVSQTVSQIIHFGQFDTVTGQAGSISSTNQRDGMSLLCVVADTEWNVLSAIGNMAYS